MDTFREVLPSNWNLTLWTPLLNSKGPEVAYRKVPILLFSKKSTFISQGYTCPKYKWQLSQAAPPSSWLGSSWRTRLIRTGSKAVKNDNMLSNWTAMIPDWHLHPTHDMFRIEAQVRGPLTCASVKIGSNPPELRRLLGESNCVGVKRRS